MTELSSTVHMQLPKDDISVIEFLKTPIPPATTQPFQLDAFTSALAPNIGIIDLSIPSPPHTIVKALAIHIRNHPVNSILCPHLHLAAEKRYPIDLIAFWEKLNFARITYQKWQESLTCITTGLATNPANLIYKQALQTLSHLPWTGRLLGHQNTVYTHQLTTFFTNEWLDDDHHLIMSELLQDILAPRFQGRVFVENTHFLSLLTSAYEGRRDYAGERALEWVRERGRRLMEGEMTHLVMVAIKDNNHWVAVILDFNRCQILYGDSAGSTMSDEAKRVLEWWTHYHTDVSFTHGELGITAQRDSFSCGMLAWDALRHELSGQAIPLMRGDNAREERIKMFMKLTDFYRQGSIGDVVVPGNNPPPPPPPPTFPSNKEAPSDTASSTGSDSDSDSDFEEDSPPTSCTKGSKRPLSTDAQSSHPPLKKARTGHTSTIHQALQTGAPRGLLLYFHKATELEHQAYVTRTGEDVLRRMEELKWQEDLAKRKSKAEKRRRARERKRDQRKREKERDVANGVRRPDGTKIQVRGLELAVPTHLEYGASAPELSRPARAVKAAIKAKTRKPQGRKAKHQPTEAKYHHWLTPFLFEQIEIARIHAGGPLWSTRRIEKELKKKDIATFQGLRRTTIEGWIDRTGERPRWSDRTLERLKQGNELGHSKGGQKGVLADHPEVVDEVVATLREIRQTGGQITNITARGVMVATILELAPEIMDRTFSDGSTFRASESFVRKWLRDVLHWSRRKGTQAAQKKPLDWEEQCYRSALRKAHIIKEEDIPAALFVNSDQTQVVYAPGDKMTWAETGSKQVSILGAEEKRAFTVLVSVASDGSVLPMQAIYTGKTPRSRPSPKAPHSADLAENGFILQESGTATYWSNFETMKTFVDKILSRWLDQRKVDLGLPVFQKSLWTIDVWSVHRSKEFRDWMAANHPNIIVDFVPGGCTSIAQPCDVGIQRPFKLSIKRSYQEDVVADILRQRKSRKADDVPIAIDTRLPILRDQSTRWIWNAFKAISQPQLVKKAFEHCTVREFNLSYDSLTGVEMRAKLRNLRQSDPSFWAELTQKQTNIPPENIPQPEDTEPADVDGDDVDVPIRSVINNIVRKRVPKGYVQLPGGTIEACAAAESFDDDVVQPMPANSDLGRGKRKRKPNTLYSNTAFWRHDDNHSDEDDN